MLALAFIAVIRPSLDEPIEFTPIVGTAPTVIQKLSEQTGQKITFNKNVANDVIAIAVPKATPREIMDQIAFTIQAKWKEEGGEWVLYRPEDQIKEQAKADRDERKKQIQKALDKLPDYKPWDSNEAKSIAMQMEAFQRQPSETRYRGDSWSLLNKKMPSNRLLHRILKSLPIDSLADVDLGTRIVYANNPNRMQKPLPGNVIPFVENFIRENNELAASWTASDENLGMFSAPRKIEKVEKVVFSLQNSALQGVRTELHMFDAKGREMGSMNSMHTFQLDMESSMFQPQKADPNDPLIELNPLAKKILASARQSMEGRPFVTPDDVRAFLQHPKQNEPLSLLNTEAVAALSKKEGKAIAIALPEIQLFANLALASDGKFTLGRYRISLAASSLTEERKGDWICYREANPHLGRSRRVDRQAFDDYFRRIDRDKRATLDGFAEFVLRYPGRLENTLFPIFLLITGSTPENFEYEDDLNMVRFFGLLTPPQKEAFKKGAEFAFTDLSAPQQSVISAFIYNKRFRNTGYSMEAEEEGTDSRNYMMQGNEPTEFFPAGIAAPFTIKAQVTDKPSWFRQRSWGAIEPTDENNIGWELFQKERLDLFPYMSDFATREDQGYAEGQSRMWNFILRLSKRTSTEVRLTDHTYPENRFTKFKDLPKEFRDKVDKQIAQLREQYKNAKPGEFGAGRGSPPPIPYR